LKDPYSALDVTYVQHCYGLKCVHITTITFVFWRLICRVDNQVVAAKGDQIHFKREDQVIPGYTARFKDAKPFSPRKV
jgi:hypothetical protein